MKKRAQEASAVPASVEPAASPCGFCRGCQINPTCPLPALRPLPDPLPQAAGVQLSPNSATLDNLLATCTATIGQQLISSAGFNADTLAALAACNVRGVCLHRCHERHLPGNNCTWPAVLLPPFLPSTASPLTPPPSAATGAHHCRRVRHGACCIAGNPRQRRAAQRHLHCHAARHPPKGHRCCARGVARRRALAAEWRGCPGRRRGPVRRPHGYGAGGADAVVSGRSQRRCTMKDRGPTHHLRGQLDAGLVLDDGLPAARCDLGAHASVPQQALLQGLRPHACGCVYERGRSRTPCARCLRARRACCARRGIRTGGSVSIGFNLHSHHTSSY